MSSSMTAPAVTRSMLERAALAMRHACRPDVTNPEAQTMLAAALRALREPDEAMLEASARAIFREHQSGLDCLDEWVEEIFTGQECVCQVSDEACPPCSRRELFALARKAHQALIDSILAGESTTEATR